MKRTSSLCLLFLLLSISSGCTTVSSTADSLSATVDAEAVIPFRLAGGSLYTVNATLNGEGPFPMIIDTGATISILFNRTAARLGIDRNSQETTNVHGIIESSLQPVVTLRDIQFGNIRRQNLRVALLDDRETQDPPAGIIGMDILTDYGLVFDAETNTISFLSRNAIDPSNFQGWAPIELRRNPYSDEDFRLYFLTMKLGGNVVPAVFDLGSSFSLMNWEGASSPAVRRYRRRQRQNWELEGAIGTFSPRVMVNYETIRSGPYTWRNWDIFVLDLETLDIIGSENSPLMIAGADLFRDTSYAVDFERQLLLIKPTSEHSKQDPDRPMTGSRIGGTDTGAVDVYDK